MKYESIYQKHIKGKNLLMPSEGQFLKETVAIITGLMDMDIQKTIIGVMSLLMPHGIHTHTKTGISCCIQY